MNFERPMPEFTSCCLFTSTITIDRSKTITPNGQRSRKASAACCTNASRLLSCITTLSSEARRSLAGVSHPCKSRGRGGHESRLRRSLGVLLAGLERVLLWGPGEFFESRSRNEFHRRIALAREPAEARDRHLLQGRGRDAGGERVRPEPQAREGRPRPGRLMPDSGAAVHRNWLGSADEERSTAAIGGAVEP